MLTMLTMLTMLDPSTSFMMLRLPFFMVIHLLDKQTLP
jgi:hypothetical protein